MIKKYVRLTTALTLVLQPFSNIYEAQSSEDQDKELKGKMFSLAIPLPIEGDDSPMKENSDLPAQEPIEENLSPKFIFFTMPTENVLIPPIDRPQYTPADSIYRLNFSDDQLFNERIKRLQVYMDLDDISLDDTEEAYIDQMIKSGKDIIQYSHPHILAEKEKNPLYVTASQQFVHAVASYIEHRIKGIKQHLNTGNIEDFYAGLPINFAEYKKQQVLSMNNFEKNPVVKLIHRYIKALAPSLNLKERESAEEFFAKPRNSYDNTYVTFTPPPFLNKIQDALSALVFFSKWDSKNNSYFLKENRLTLYDSVSYLSRAQAFGSIYQYLKIHSYLEKLAQTPLNIKSLDNEKKDFWENPSLGLLMSIGSFIPYKYSEINEDKLKEMTSITKNRFSKPEEIIKAYRYVHHFFIQWPQLKKLGLLVFHAKKLERSFHFDILLESAADLIPELHDIILPAMESWLNFEMAVAMRRISELKEIDSSNALSHMPNLTLLSQYASDVAYLTKLNETLSELKTVETLPPEATLRVLTILGEASKNISNRVKGQLDNDLWNHLSKMRNRIHHSHKYLRKLGRIIKETNGLGSSLLTDFKSFADQIKKILSDLPKTWAEIKDFYNSASLLLSNDPKEGMSHLFEIMDPIISQKNYAILCKTKASRITDVEYSCEEILVAIDTLNLDPNAFKAVLDKLTLLSLGKRKNLSEFYKRLTMGSRFQYLVSEGLKQLNKIPQQDFNAEQSSVFAQIKKLFDNPLSLEGSNAQDWVNILNKLSSGKNKSIVNGIKAIYNKNDTDQDEQKEKEQYKRLILRCLKLPRDIIVESITSVENAQDVDEDEFNIYLDRLNLSSENKKNIQEFHKKLRMGGQLECLRKEGLGQLKQIDIRKLSSEQKKNFDEIKALLENKTGLLVGNFDENTWQVILNDLCNSNKKANKSRIFNSIKSIYNLDQVNEEENNERKRYIELLLKDKFSSNSDDDWDKEFEKLIGNLKNFITSSNEKLDPAHNIIIEKALSRALDNLGITDKKPWEIVRRKIHAKSDGSIAKTKIPSLNKKEKSAQEHIENVLDNSMTAVTGILNHIKDLDQLTKNPAGRLGRFDLNDFLTTPSLHLSAAHHVEFIRQYADIIKEAISYLIRYDIPSEYRNNLNRFYHVLSQKMKNIRELGNSFAHLHDATEFKMMTSAGIKFNLFNTVLQHVDGIPYGNKEGGVNYLRSLWKELEAYNYTLGSAYETSKNRILEAEGEHIRSTTVNNDKPHHPTRAVFNATFNGQPIQFEEQKILGDGNCGFTGLGLARTASIEALMKRLDDENIKRMIQDDAREAFRGRDLPPQLMKELHQSANILQNQEEIVRDFLACLNDRYIEEGQQRLGILEMLHYLENAEGEEALEQKNILQKLQKQLEEIQASIDNQLGTPLFLVKFLYEEFIKGKRYLSYVKGSFGTLYALAHIHNLEVHIWVKDENTGMLIENFTVPARINDEPSNIIHLHHTDNLNHFNLLNIVSALNESGDVNSNASGLPYQFDSSSE